MRASPNGRRRTANAPRLSGSFWGRFTMALRKEQVGGPSQAGLLRQSVWRMYGKDQSYVCVCVCLTLCNFDRGFCRGGAKPNADAEARLQLLSSYVNERRRKKQQNNLVWPCVHTYKAASSRASRFLNQETNATRVPRKASFACCCCWSVITFVIVALVSLQNENMSLCLFFAKPKVYIWRNFTLFRFARAI